MEKSTKANNTKPILGVTMGDFNGIAPEVIMKALSDARVLRSAAIVIYGSTKVFSYYRKQFKLDQFSYNRISKLDQLHFKKVNILDLGDHPPLPLALYKHTALPPGIHSLDLPR